MRRRVLVKPAWRGGVELVIGDRPRFFELIDFGKLICNTEANDTTQLVACLFGLLSVTLGHASSLSYQVGENADVGRQNEHQHP